MDIEKHRKALDTYILAKHEYEKAVRQKAEHDRVAYSLNDGIERARLALTKEQTVFADEVAEALKPLLLAGDKPEKAVVTPEDIPTRWADGKTIDPVNRGG